MCEEGGVGGNVRWLREEGGRQQPEASAAHLRPCGRVACCGACLPPKLIPCGQHCLIGGVEAVAQGAYHELNAGLGLLHARGWARHHVSLVRVWHLGRLGRMGVRGVACG